MKKLALVVLLASLAACGGAEDRKAAYMEKGQALYDAGDYDKARLEFKNVLQIDPKDIPSRFMLAQTLEKTQDWRGAAGHYLGVIEADPTHREALSRMGQIYLLGRNTEEAKKLAEKLLALNAKDPDGLTLMGGIKALDKNVDGALADVKAALESQPGHVNASALAASIYLQTNKADEAVATLKAALEKDPKNSTVQALLARVYTQIGQKDEAEKLFRSIVDAEPTVLGHRLRLAQFLAEQQKMADAEAVLVKAAADITADPKDANTAKLSLVEFQAKSVDAEKAINTLKAFIEKEPKSFELRSALAKLYEAANKPEEAKTTYQAIIDDEAEPNAPQALAAKTRKAMVMARTQDTAGARTLVEEVLKENPRDQDALVLRGSLSLEAGDPGAAIADYRSALKDAPNSPDISRLLARAHQANKEPQLAIDTLLKAAEANPAALQLRGDLANLYSQQQNLDAVVGQLDEVLKQDPDNRPAIEGKFKTFIYQKNWTKAMEVADQLKTLLPNDPIGFYYAGLVYQAQQKLPESIEQFESALAVSPDAVQPLSQLVKSHLAMDKRDVAEKRLAEVIERNSKNFVAHNLLGELQLTSKRYEEAKKSFETAIVSNEKWAILYRNLATAKLALKDEDGAVKTMEEGIEKTGGSSLLVTGLAAYLEKAGKLDQAVEQYEKVLKADPKSQLAANNLAMLLIEYKTDDASKQRARELSKLLADAKEPAYLDTIGWVEYKFGDYQKASEYLERAIQGAPDAALIRYHLGMAYVGLGNKVLAKDNLKQAVDANIDFKGLDEAKAELAKL
jgi:tetratricopeptide (TPR) repeat protein